MIPSQSPSNRESIGCPPVDVTILMPCLNEEQTLPECIRMAHEAGAMLADLELTYEVLISDNGSTDKSIEIATSQGCRVAHCPDRGYGNALIYGCNHAAGSMIMMGDSDASYDFREGVAMILKLREGYDLCMGSRFLGEIKPGAMPWKNRYIGNPVLTGFLNLLYRSGLGDAHCGLRAFTRSAFDRLRLESRGMELASEMVVKSALLGLKRTEVPVTLHKDGRDRPPHLRPWRDGWRHVKFLLTLCPLWFYFLPAAILMGLSLAIFIALLMTPPGEMFKLGRLWVGDHWLILSGGFFSIGYQSFLMGIAANKYTKALGFRKRSAVDSVIDRFAKVDALIGASVLLGLVGVGIIVRIFVVWSDSRYGSLQMTRETTVATTLIVASFQTMFGGFLISMLGCDD